MRGEAVKGKAKAKAKAKDPGKLEQARERR